MLESAKTAKYWVKNIGANLFVFFGEKYIFPKEQCYDAEGIMDFELELWKIGRAGLAQPFCYKPVYL